MISLIMCYCCKHYDKEKNNCPARPNGITDNIIRETHSYNDCGNGLKYELPVDNVNPEE